MVKILVTQALDERDLLVNKINDKIDKASFIDIMKHNEEKVYDNQINKDEYMKDVNSKYQQIMDLIDYFTRLDSAIIESNAHTCIETSYGKMSVASAISLRNRLRGSGGYKDSGDFEAMLYEKMKDEYEYCIRSIEKKNQALQSTAEDMRLSILGKDSKVKDDKPLEVVETYIKENTYELVDPLSIVKKMDYLNDKQKTLLRELDTQIKVSNATTFVEL